MMSLLTYILVLTFAVAAAVTHSVFEMPHLRSPEALALRRARALDRGFVSATPSGHKHVAVPAPIASRVRAVASSMHVHRMHNQLAGSPSHFAKVATLAVRDQIGEPSFRAAMVVHKDRDKAIHAWGSSSSLPRGGASARRAVWADMNDDDCDLPAPGVTRATASPPRVVPAQMLTVLMMFLVKLFWVLRLPPSPRLCVALLRVMIMYQFFLPLRLLLTALLAAFLLEYKVMFFPSLRCLEPLSRRWQGYGWTALPHGHSVSPAPGARHGSLGLLLRTSGAVAMIVFLPSIMLPLSSKRVSLVRSCVRM